MKKLYLIFSILLLFFGCNNSINNNEKYQSCCKVRGKISDSRALRSALSSFEADSIYIVNAWYLDDNSTTPEAVKGSVNAESLSWTIILNKTGNWKIECLRLAKNDAQDCLMKGSVELEVEKLGKNESIEIDPIPLYLNNSLSLPAKIDLEISSSIPSVKTLKYHCVNTTEIEDKELTFTDGKVQLLFEELPTDENDYYEFVFSFLDENENCVYSCCELIQIFPGFTTDKWIGNSSYINDGKFSLTNEVAANYIDYSSFKTPIVLYDRDWLYSHREFESPTPGVFIYRNVEDALAMQNGKRVGSTARNDVYDFTIDPVTQSIFMHTEYGKDTANIIYEKNIADGTSKRQYSFTKTNVVDRVSYISAYNGDLYAFLRGGGSGDYEMHFLTEDMDAKLTIFDASGQELENGAASFNTFVVYDDYLYTAEGESASIIVKKYEISKADFTLTEIASLTKSLELLGVSASGDYGIRSYDVSISDMQVSADGKRVYIGFYDRYYASDANYRNFNYSRGGIFTVENTDDDANPLEFVSLDGSSNLVFGWYTEGWHPTDENGNQYFWGVQKFLARKPDELVIADEGGYIDTIVDNEYNHTYTAHNKNRLVTVNLETFAMTAEDVNVGFDSYLRSSSQFMFVNYVGSGYQSGN